MEPTPLQRIIFGQYVNEPCRICGTPIGWEDIEGLVWAGYSQGNESRCAHLECWERKPPQPEWAFPIDEPTQEVPF